MHAFKDQHGREWELDLDAWTLYRFENSRQVSLLNSAANGHVPTNHVFDLAWFIVKDHAERFKITNLRDWLDSIGKQSIGAMTAAMMAEFAEFFPLQDQEKGDAGDTPANPLRGSGNESGESPPSPEQTGGS